MKKKNLIVFATIIIGIILVSAIIYYARGMVIDRKLNKTENSGDSSELVKSNKIVAMYETIIDEIIASSPGLISGAKYISLDVDTFLSTTVTDGIRQELKEEEKETLLNYCEKYNKTVYAYSLEDLKREGLYKDDIGGNLEGVLIYITDVEKIKENKAILKAVEYKGPLGMVMERYVLTYKNNKWNIKTTETSIS